MVHETDYPEIISGCCRKQRVSRSRSGARNFCASAILDGKYEEVLVANRIDNSIAAFANPIEVVQAIEFRDTGGTRTGAECMEPFHKKFPKRFGECVELLLSKRGQENCGDRLVQSEPQFFQNNIKRPGAVLVRLGQGRAGIDEIDTIFQGLQESQVVDRHHRSDRSATSAQQHSLVAECRAVNRIGESLSLLISLWISHGAPPQTASGQTDGSFEWCKLYSG